MAVRQTAPKSFVGPTPRSPVSPGTAARRSTQSAFKPGVFTGVLGYEDPYTEQQLWNKVMPSINPKGFYDPSGFQFQYDPATSRLSYQHPEIASAAPFQSFVGLDPQMSQYLNSPEDNYRMGYTMASGLDDNALLNLLNTGAIGGDLYSQEVVQGASGVAAERGIGPFAPPPDEEPPPVYGGGGAPAAAEPQGMDPQMMQLLTLALAGRGQDDDEEQYDFPWAF